MSKKLFGTVTSNGANKTITVAVDIRKTHSKYKKQYTLTKKYLVHDEHNKAQKGDKVYITETRPISKNKYFTLVDVNKDEQTIGVDGGLQ